MRRVASCAVLALSVLAGGCSASTPSSSPPAIGQQASLINDAPMTASQEEAIRDAIERHWNPPIGMANITAYVVSLRLHMKPDGTVQKMELINPKNDDPGYRVLALSAEQALLMTVQSEGRLPISKPYPTLVLTWDMKEVCKEVGGC